ncbi:MAG: hypothetical protein HZB39_17060 [Planctomycetes bacterium]|nr:hypothetical protein [Planctomycetota bacterium]
MRTTALLSAVLLANAVAAQAPIAAGEPEDFQFQAAGLQLDGISKLSELRGKPILVEFWGIN